MKKSVFILLLLSIFIFDFEAQTPRYCLTDELLKINLDSDPEIKKNYLKRQQDLKIIDSNNNISNAAKPMSPSVYKIPIVFHILHQLGTENIDDSQVIDALNILNKAFRKQNTDTINILPPFQAADTHIEFRLATKDTNGNCTNGILHHYDAKTNWNWLYPPYHHNYTWNSSKYLNVYVVKTISPFGVAGYSSFPGTNHPARDIVVILSNFLGSIGTGDSLKTATLTHEVGHWLDLQHVWGNGNFGSVCGDDGVTDTPITPGNFGCPAPAPAACNPTITENFQNYMDYTDCQYMFTVGQANRMIVALNNSASGRNNLSTQSNLIATGIVNPSTPCPLKAFYSLSQSVTCVGKFLTFIDNSYNGAPTSRIWSATHAIITASTSIATTISFTATGTQTITLTISNQLGSSSYTNTIFVSDGTANVTSTYFESFETTGLPQNFNILNFGGTTWTQNTLAASSGINSFYIDGIQNAIGSLDILETPFYDFKNNKGATLSFKCAYAKYRSSNNDLFKVQATSDCCESWINVFTPTGTSLSSVPGSTSSVPYFPSAEQFVTYTLSQHPLFHPFLISPNVKLRFFFRKDTLTGEGNNIFIDDINFTAPNSTNINELPEILSFQLYPNPSKEEIDIEFKMNNASEIKYHVSDILGSTVLDEKGFYLKAGNHHIRLTERMKFKPGFYILNFQLKDQSISRKFLIE